MIKEEEELRNYLKLAMDKAPYFKDDQDVFHQGIGVNPNPSKQYKNEWVSPFAYVTSDS
jgi:hypothetical protein